jgi:hypothetical protein
MVNPKHVRCVFEPVLVQDHHGWRAHGFPTKQLKGYSDRYKDTLLQITVEMLQ